MNAQTPNAVTTQQGGAPVERWQAVLEKAMPSIAASLPEHITMEKFRQVAATAIGSTPGLQKCMKSNPAAVLTALSLCAKDGLLPDNREAALVPYNNNLTYIPMISGVLKRMRNSGEIASVSSAIVHEHDLFEFIQGDEEKLVHQPNWKGERGDAVAAYAIIRLRSGEIYREVMSKAEIMAVKNASRAQNGPWSGAFALEMWRKSVLKRAAKYCPLSDERIRVMLDRDNHLYDMEKANLPAPSQERFASLRNPDYRPRYGDDVGNTDVIDADTGEILDAEPVRDVNEDVQEASQDESGEPEADAGADGPEVPFDTPSEPETGQSAQADQDEQSRMAQRLHHDTLSAIQKTTSAETAAGILNRARNNDAWPDVPKGQRDQLQQAVEAKGKR